METDSLKTQYFMQYIRKGVHDIFAAQKQIATSRIYQVGHERTIKQGSGSTIKGRSGALMNALNSPNYLITPDGQGVRTQITYPLYIRFLDMKRHGNYKIYNRQIWGIMYKETFVNIKYEYGDWLKNHVHDLLNSAFNTQTK
jgi:hypothetical protein